MDNGSTYVNKRLKYFCRLGGIDLQTPTTFSPHKTDIAALRICTLKSMASCMIKAKSLDPSLEVEAISSATHILNRSPHLVLDGKNAFEAWCGKKPNVRRFNACGWLGYFLNSMAYDEEAAVEFTKTFNEGEASI